MQGGWQPPPGGGGYGQPPGAYGQPPQGGGYGQPYAPQAPYGMPAGMGPMPVQYGSYEFNDYENAVIDKAASRARTWGIISIVIGALQLMGALGAILSPGLVVYVPMGIVQIVVGTSFLGAGNALKAVVNTQGNDIPYVMQALEKLGSAFFVQIIVTVIGFVAVALIMVLAVFLIAGAAAAGRT